VSLQDEANPLSVIFLELSEGAHVLDIGAGNGILGWLVKSLKPSIIIDGIEPSSAGAAIARQFYRNFYEETFQGAKDKLNLKEYDYIVLADVIEHVADPLGFLMEISNLARPTCKIIISIPNIAHYSVRLELLNGEFKYVDSGLLERTHLRFFTLETFMLMIAEAGLHADRIYYLFRHVEPIIENQLISLSFWQRCRLLREKESVAYQYLCVLCRGSGDTKILERGEFKAPVVNPLRVIFGVVKKGIKKCAKYLFASLRTDNQTS
jgi:2-polyprenyl-3-methyl-5-hydroxy-6-metoxy-1,4-benzoquinol methylase